MIGIDAHVIDGRPQGSRTVLINLLKAVERLGKSSAFTLYGTDPAACQASLGPSDFEFRQVPKSGNLARLLHHLPDALNRDGCEMAFWQYVASPLYRGRDIVCIHDVLPFTHPHLFPRLFQMRCAATFYYSMQRASVILTVSETSAAAICELFPRFSKKVRVARNGPSFSPDVYMAATRPHQNHSAPYILAVGRIEPRKNIDVLARAFLKARLDGVQLVVVGKHDLGSVTIPTDPAISIRSGVSDRELIELYRHASLFAYPSSAEGFGLPLLDAVLFGVPSISSNKTAMPEVSGGFSRFFDPDIPAAEEQLAALMRDHFVGTAIPRVPDQDRLIHLEKFSWENAARAFLDTCNL